ncbi:putative RNA 2'-phosphotransferase [Stackebrandtia albiflava]|uniref:Probable RNA 2'-phosphotransferase n=1 Tax=Stackebrandtia albiflava TaxID=406432 RepID=A0A562V9N6_9ACTN|nr:RNA 2'-phosphotransferase [Stackebrandtia albiflava]TWJ14594.1 putative RNA 2'-phosphotransferase [Stackebrandtia albiflava]
MRSSESVSRRLAHILRHDPASAGVKLDEAGWADVDAVLAGLAAEGRPIGRAELERLVRDNDKRRFALDGDRIRARQGHSVPVDLGLAPASPPELLFHGTVGRFLPSIREQGLLPGNRHHVHLSPDRATARTVGGRRGRPVVLTVLAARLAATGAVFHHTDNGVWLTAAVPPGYLREP